jgi:deazaflavin-dependent oxidoreductase (nitroreductase family)
MPLDGEYEPSSLDWVRKQVERYEASGGAEYGKLHGTDWDVIIVTSRGVKSGKLRKNPVMRVEHEGRYAAVASMGGQPEHPVWYHNLLADPHVEVQDGAVKQDMVAREVTGDEKAAWWERAVAAYPPYAEYQQRTERVIPVFVLEPTGDSTGS